MSRRSRENQGPEDRTCQPPEKPSGTSFRPRVPPVALAVASLGLVLVLVLFLVLVLGLWAVGPPVARAASALRPTLMLSGSSTLLPVAERAAEVYLADRPDLMLTIAGSGTGEGVRSLIDGNCDIGNASRDLKPEESRRAAGAGIRLVRHVVAVDCLAVIVHPSNPVSGLTMAQLKGIYDGSITNWSQLGGPDMVIVAINRDSSSGTFEMWIEKVLLGARHRRDVQVQSSSGGVAYAVAGNKHAVGYVSLGFLSDKVKTLAVDGLRHSKETATSGAYPIVRDLYMFVREDHQVEVDKFLDFILSDEGRALV